MVGQLRTPLKMILPVAALGALAACSPSGFGGGERATTASVAQPPAIAPVQTGSVESSDLPPIEGAATVPTVPGNTATADAGTSASAPGFMLEDISSPGNTTGGRDLSGSLSIEQLLGGWTVVAGAQECRLNLTYTAKGATGRYRASTPECEQEVLATVTSWQLLGNQIQLYDESDAIVATLLRSGSRFAGTLAGGQAISLVG